jgi:hypothetical protein
VEGPIRGGGLFEGLDWIGPDEIGDGMVEMGGGMSGGGSESGEESHDKAEGEMHQSLLP